MDVKSLFQAASHASSGSPHLPAATAPPMRLCDDESLVLLGVGGFGRHVLHILGQDFARLGIPSDRASCLGIDLLSSTRGGGDAGTADPPEDAAEPNAGPPCVWLPPFDGQLYVSSLENASLRAAVSHLPADALRGLADGRAAFPGLGLIAFHRYDETLLTHRVLAAVDDARLHNPGGRIKCIVVFNLSDGLASGLVPPLLFRIREHLKHRKVRLELFLATPEGHPLGANPPMEQLEHNCVATAMLWEQILLGDRDLHYPGKDGVREDRCDRGPLAHRTWIFSGSGGSTQDSRPALASIVANCISTLETTRLGSYLDGERVHYTEDALERTWSGRSGGRHSSALLAMNVGGLKIDCLPGLVHLRAARHFLDEVTGSGRTGGLDVQATAAAGLEAAGITEENLVRELHIGEKPLTHAEIRAASLPQEKLYSTIRQRLDEDLGGLMAVAEDAHQPAGMDALLQRAQDTIRARAREVANSAGAYLPGAVLFYQAAGAQLEELRAQAARRVEHARMEMAASTDRRRLDVLLERLKSDTIREDGGRFGLFERFVATITVAVPTQVRKIVEVSSGIRGLALELASASVACQIYSSLARFCAQECEALQAKLYVLNHATSICLREEEHLQRAGRAAFTYQRGRFEPLVELLWQRLATTLQFPGPPEVLARLGGDLAQLVGEEHATLQRIIEAVRPDIVQLAAATDQVMASEPLVREALQESLVQFFPTVRLERERFPTLETVRARYVLCTRRMFEAHRQDLFAGYHHLETDNPYNVLFTDHEEGIPFLMLGYLGRIHAEYKAQRGQEGTILAHATAAWATELPLLDA
jgi:hypothetical protein